MIPRSAVDDAVRRIRDRVRTTPVIIVESATFGTTTPVTLKLENLQHSGSFKVRGAFNRILSTDPGATGVIAASGGNHGLGVAYAAAALGLPAEIFVPETTAPVKVTRLRALGASVTRTGRVYADALAASEKRAAESGALVIHAYDQPEVVAGQATVGIELFSQADVDTVLVAVGGGGLIGGITLAAPPNVRIVAVEPATAPTLHAALAAGKPVDVAVGGIAVDSLGASRLGALAWEILSDRDVQSVLVSDDSIAKARRLLWDHVRVVAEVGGATALAALTCGAYVPDRGERVAVLVCGGNTDPSDLVGAPETPVAEAPLL